MGIHFRRVVSQRKYGGGGGGDVPKGHFVVYVGEEMKRFVVPMWYLRMASFKGLLQRAEDEFGFEYRKGGIRVPCDEHEFTSLAQRLNGHC